MNHELSIENLNFYWRMKDSVDDHNPEIPDFLPFSLTLDPRFNLLKQKYNEKTDRFLNEVYKLDENVGYLQDGHQLAELYGNDFFDYLDSHLPKDKDNVSVLEIGCGGCYVLKYLQDQGYRVSGCDPSPVAKTAAEKLNIPMHSVFYAPEKITERYDVLIHYDVLEHIYEPQEFLRQHAKNLANDGNIFFAVPDCSAAIKNGDVSMFIHEHVNYFDEESLNNVVEEAGFKVEDISKGDNVGTLYCSAVKSEVNKPVTDCFSDKKIEAFVSRYRENLMRIKSELTDNTAIYIPLRALPYLCEIDIKENLIFVDDNKEIHGKYFDGFDIPVSSFEEMLSRTPDVVIVFSYIFGEKIKKKIKTQNENIHVISLDDIFKSNNDG